LVGSSALAKAAYTLAVAAAAVEEWARAWASLGDVFGPNKPLTTIGLAQIVGQH